MRWIVSSSILALVGVAVACGTSDDDASPPPSDAGSSDADAGALDGSPSDADARPDPVDAGCVEIFHEHFLTIDPVWTTTTASGTVTTSPDGGQYYTGALRAEVTPSGATGRAVMERELDASLPRTVALAFAMRVEAVSATGNLALGCTLELRSTAGDASFGIGSGVTDSKLRIDDVALGNVTLDKWYQVKLHVSGITGAGARVIGDIDGTRLVDRDVTFPAPLDRVHIECGIDFATENAGATVFVDDVVLATCADPG